MARPPQGSLDALSRWLRCKAAASCLLNSGLCVGTWGRAAAAFLAFLLIFKHRSMIKEEEGRGTGPGWWDTTGSLQRRDRKRCAVKHVNENVGLGAPAHGLRVSATSLACGLFACHTYVELHLDRARVASLRDCDELAAARRTDGHWVAGRQPAVARPVRVGSGRVSKGSQQGEGVRAQLRERALS